MKADARFEKAVEGGLTKAAFRRYYALRASATASRGAHDEWNIFRLLNERRRADGKLGTPNQIPMLFDGRGVDPALAEAPVSDGYVGKCATVTACRFDRISLKEDDDAITWHASLSRGPRSAQLQAPAQATCYLRLDRGDNIIYRGTQPPVDMSERGAVAATRCAQRGEYLLFVDTDRARRSRS